MVVTGQFLMQTSMINLLLGNYFFVHLDEHLVLSYDYEIDSLLSLRLYSSEYSGVQLYS